MGISILIISSFVIILCVYVYQEYFKNDVREEFNEEKLYEDTSFVEYLDKTDSNWRNMKKEIESTKKDVSDLKKIAMEGSLNDVIPNMDEIHAKIDLLTNDLSDITRRMDSLEGSMERVQNIMQQVERIQSDLSDIRRNMPDTTTTVIPSWATKQELDSLASQMNTRMDTRKATVDASLKNIDGYYDEVMSSVDNRFNEYEQRLDRYNNDIDQRFESVRDDQNAVSSQTSFNSEVELKDLRSEVNKNTRNIKDMQEHHHDQYALIGEVNNNIEESVEKYLQNRTFNTNEYSHSNMRAEIEDIIREQQGNNSMMSSMSNYLTRSEFQSVKDSQSQKDSAQDRRIGNLNDSFEMKNVVTYGELDERLDKYVTKMRFATLFDDDTVGIMPIIQNSNENNSDGNSTDQKFKPAPAVEYINDLMK